MLLPLLIISKCVFLFYELRKAKKSSFLIDFSDSRTHINHPMMILVMSLSRASITMVQSWKSLVV